MYSFLGQNSFNFFKHDLSNHVPDFYENTSSTLTLIKRTFSKATNYPVLIGLSDMAKYDRNGNKYIDVKFPFRIIFHPSKQLHLKFSDKNPNKDLNEQLKILEPQIMFYVYVVDEPNSIPRLFGEIETLTSPTSSNFGDKQLFFQHVKMEDDFKYRNDWKEKTDKILKRQRDIPNYVKKKI